MTGKIVAITGAANGIGRAATLRFAGDGADVAILDREQAPLVELAAECEALGRRAFPVVADLTDRDAVKDAFGRIATGFGPIDVLLNNVGQSSRDRASPFWKSEPGLWDFIVDVSLMTAFACSRQVVPGMRERKSGRIVNITSEAPFTGGAGSVEYAAAKAGVIGFTRALALEMAPFNVTVNAVGPGATRTRAADAWSAETKARLLAAVPMGRFAEPEEIADAIHFLASDRASFITGQTLLVNGGRIFN